MKPATVNINKKEYTVKFEFKALRYITEAFGYDSFGDVQQQLLDLGFDDIKTDLTFKQYDFLGKLVLYSVQSNTSNKATRLKHEDVVEYLFNNLDKTTEVLQVFSDAVYKRMGKMTPNPQPTN